ncbi:MAG: alpha/beta hydrolase [Desulfobacteraceae bacterium]|nr:alpha/beta hydrolase [Desulfobacteraceae bacterium]
MEDIIKFCCEKIELDGLFQYTSNEKIAIITHPHPLYGGNMENPVVELLQEELTKQGYSTLRFNFRQVKMEGSDEDSIKDLEAAICFLNTKGFKHNILLAGYSYGSWINTSAVSKGLKITDSIMISPPIAFLDYKNIKTLPSPGLIVTGTNDEIAPPELVKKRTEEWNSAFKLKVIKGCDHFYGGYTRELKKIISDYLLD